MTIANGQTPDADEVLRITKIDQIYTASGFDTSGAEASVELTAVPSTNLTGNANFAVVKFTVVAVSSGAGSAGGNPQVKAQIKETGQSYADIISYKTLIDRSGSAGGSATVTTDYTVVATLTAGMKTNGFQVKLFGLVSPTTGSVTNVQTTLEVKP